MYVADNRYTPICSRYPDQIHVNMYSGSSLSMMLFNACRFPIYRAATRPKTPARRPPILPVTAAAPPVNLESALDDAGAAACWLTLAVVLAAADEVTATLTTYEGTGPVMEMAWVLVGMAALLVTGAFAGAVPRQPQTAWAELPTARTSVDAVQAEATQAVRAWLLMAAEWEHWQAKSMNEQPCELAAEVRQACPHEGMASAWVRHAL